MNIVIPKGIKNQEHRVSMIPASAKDLVKRGHTVYVQKNAGAGASYTDDQYIACGAIIVDTAEEIFAQSTLIVTHL